MQICSTIISKWRTAARLPSRGREAESDLPKKSADLLKWWGWHATGRFGPGSPLKRKHLFQDGAMQSVLQCRRSISPTPISPPQKKMWEIHTIFFHLSVMCLFSKKCNLIIKLFVKLSYLSSKIEKLAPVMGSTSRGEGPCRSTTNEKELPFVDLTNSPVSSPMSPD